MTKRRKQDPEGLALAHPRWWPTWLGLGLLRLGALLPLRVTRALGRGIGRVAMAVAPERRHVTQVNLELCFPEYSDAERVRLIKRHFQAIGESLFETAFGWWASPSRLLRLRRFQGLEHLQAAHAQGRGVILLTGHFVTTDIAGQLLAAEVPLSATYAPPANAVVRRLLPALRTRYLRRLIHHGDVRRTVRTLRSGEIVGHIPDQGAKKGRGAALHFFGHPASTHTATAKLARMSGAAVVPYHPVRLEDGTYELRFEPALADFPDADLEVATQRVNDTIEAHVRAAPGQYLWSHKRFKPAHKGDPDPYR